MLISVLCIVHFLVHIYIYLYIYNIFGIIMNIAWGDSFHNVVLAGGVLLNNCHYKANFCLVTAVVSNIDSTPSFTLSWDTEAPSDTSFTVWYSTDSHESNPSSPPQGALVVSGIYSTSVTITLANSDNSYRPFYVWIAGITPNGQQGPYSQRRQVEVCQSSGGESMEWCILCKHCILMGIDPVVMVMVNFWEYMQ